MSTLLIDNYDSYTYNVLHLLAAVSGEEPIVVRNDVVSWAALSRWDFDAIVLSPGPGRPERWHDFGVCADILRLSEIPVLGVCLGHQGLGHLLDGTVASAPVIMHGRLSSVRHDGAGLFAGIPQGFSVVRYHSLAVAGDLGPDGRVTAWTDEGVVMGLEHTRRPIWGVQFHPESIATDHGRRLVENFYALAQTHNSGRRGRSERRRLPPTRPRAAARRRGGARLRLRTRSVPGEPPAETLFERLFGTREHAFWLDSADAPTALSQRSFMGTTMGPRSCVIEYDVERRRVTLRRDGDRTVETGSIFEVLQRELDRHTVEAPPAFPPGLVGGYVGYLGYECKADCGSPNAHRSAVPDAVLMLANRVVAIDHLRRRTHLVALCDAADDAEAERWLEQAERVLRETLAGQPGAPAPGERAPERARPPVRFRSGRGREQYLADITRCHAALSAGESYEICLTDQIHCDAHPAPFALYRELRRSNPAPFAAYLRLGDLAVLSSSPERFLAVDRERRVQARPIKGTAARSSDAVLDEARRAELLGDEKTFAEHLMIVDLLRNDLGRVCALDTVRVPRFMVVEAYTTVHQLVSTVTGTLEPERSPVECVRACFPGGSMTGAPKLRTMGIIDDIEREARGIYSGALGYFGFDGSVDLSIVIRTIVMRPGATTIGAGGAIVMQSDAEQEFDEVLLKARAPMRAIARTVTGSDAPEAWTIELEPARAAAAA
ncbi:MAG TPA: aminodeoxychorismate synthase component I [Solirubrobacteraceae bacterium]